MIAPLADPPERLVDAIHARLRAAVVDGELQPGEQLSVPMLARELSVSRAPVREAVLQLVADGLAWERPRRGVVVATLELPETDHIHRVREVLEGLAARLCAERGGAELVKSLESVLGALSRDVDGHRSRSYLEDDEAFHRTVAEACGNPPLTELIARLHLQMKIALVKVADDPQHRRASVRELRTVLDAIRDRDPSTAEAAMRAHIERTRGLLREQKEDE